MEKVRPEVERLAWVMEEVAQRPRSHLLVLRGTWASMPGARDCREKVRPEVEKLVWATQEVERLRRQSRGAVAERSHTMELQ